MGEILEHDVSATPENSVGVYYPDNFEIEVFPLINGNILIDRETDSLGIDVTLDTDDENIFIEESIEDVPIEFSYFEDNEILVVVGGTVIFDPATDLIPLIKEYLGNPNDLTSIYIGNQQIEVNAYTHDQSVPATQWVIQHNLNKPNVVIMCFTTGRQYIIANVQHINNNLSYANFGYAIAGTAECR